MGVFIIVNSSRRKIILGIVLGIAICVGIYANNVSPKEDIEVNNDLLTAQQTNFDDKKTAKGNLIYSVDNNAKLQNPFSFAHESEQDMALAAKAETKTIEQPAKIIEPQTKQIMNVKNEETQNSKTDMKQNNFVCRLEAILHFNGEYIALVKINDVSYRVHKGDILENCNVLDIGKRNLLLLSASGELLKYELAGF